MELQVGVKVILINNDDQYLLLKRSDPLPDGSGYRWDVPGGRINPSEELLSALKREVTEETDLHLQTEPVLIGAQDIFVPQNNTHTVRLTYTCHVERSAPKLGNEHSDFAWVDASNIADYAVDDYLRETLKDVTEP